MTTRAETCMSQLESLIQRIDALVGERETREQTILRRIAEYEQALRDAIEALEQTKDSFRSRRLKILRLRLAQVLREGEPTQPTPPAD